jgi:hypothetical protein
LTARPRPDTFRRANPRRGDQTDAYVPIRSVAGDPAVVGRKYLTIEKPGPGRDFVEKVGSYLRFLPKKGNRVAPVFINAHNYLTCPDNEKKWQVNDIKQVTFDKRSGSTVIGFFFDKPACENPTFHMEPIVGDA